MQSLLKKLPRLGGLGMLPGLLLTVAACGGGDKSEDESSTPTVTSSETASASSPGASCPAVPYTVHLKAARGATIGTDDQSFQVTSAKAVIMAGGAGYSIYLANFELDEAVVGGLAAPVPPEGGTLITIFLTTFNARGVPATVQVGDVIPHTSEATLTFRVVTQVGSQSYNSSAAARGTFTVTATGDHVCGEIDYSDSATADLSDVQSLLKGTIGATVVN